MGLLSTEVVTTLVGGNVLYYKNLGYEIPTKIDKYGKQKFDLNHKISVDVNHLKPGSNVKVRVCCDCCDKKYEIAYGDYIKNNREGKIYCRLCALKLFNSGENNYSYNPLLTKEERENGRHYPEYTEFIKRVLARDNYTCQCCGQEHGDLKVHHLNGYSWYKEGRVDDTNGITLCNNCHSNFHAIYGNKHSTKEEFEEWFGKSIELVKCGIEITPCKRVYCVEDDILYKDTKEVSNIYGINREYIYRVCNHEQSVTKGYHFLWEDEYLQTPQELLESLKNKSPLHFKKVVCITTEKIFETVADAAKYYDINYHGISQCCKLKCTGRYSYCGKMKDGTELKWLYYDDYLNISKEEKENLLSESHNNNKNKTVICITTGIKFNRVVDGGIKYGLKSPTGISLVCKGKQNYAGKLPDGTPLKWMYYDDFLKLSQEEQNEILARNKDSSNDESFNM